MSEADNRVKKGEFVEIKFTGYSNGEMFDSNIEEDLKKISPKSKPQKTIVAVGKDFVVSGLDKDLEGKEVGKKYSVEIQPREGFGNRKRELIRTIPLSAFKESEIKNPQAGMVLSLDNQLVKIIAVSGARVITDFNNPLSGKVLKYDYTITRIVKDDKEIVEAVFENIMRMVPEFDISGDKVIMKGPKGYDMFVNSFKDKFKDLTGKELDFEEKKEDE